MTVDAAVQVYVKVFKTSISLFNDNCNNNNNNNNSNNNNYNDNVINNKKAKIIC